MELMLILCAGFVIGAIMEKRKQAAVAAAYRRGRRDARQAFKDIRVQKMREAIPVPGYAEARWMDHGVEHCKIVSIDEIARKAVTEGRAVGRIQ